MHLDNFCRGRIFGWFGTESVDDGDIELLAVVQSFEDEGADPTRSLIMSVVIRSFTSHHYLRQRWLLYVAGTTS